MKAIPSEELTFSYSKSSGKGGQNVNKVSTRATCKWNILNSAIVNQGLIDRFLKKYGNRVTDDGYISISCGIYRSQPRNKEECITRLQEMLKSVWQPPKVRRKTKPKKSSIYKRLDNKKKHADKKKTRQKVKY